MAVRPRAHDHSGLPKDVVTKAIREHHEGVPGAADRLWELVYPWFHRLARVLLAHDSQRRQLEPEDLLHDAFDRIDLGYLQTSDATRAHLCRWVLQAMRWVLVDSARRTNVRRRDFECGNADAEGVLTDRDGVSLLEHADLQDRLDRLARCDRAAFHVLELWLSGESTIAEIAAMEGYSASKAGALLHAAFARMRAMDGDASCSEAGHGVA
ncbi:MAG TPA: ECF-type sigma factor [Planctomycetota bacterium]|nr:ECF-type sigma factor [Planctomycetota bacterium]